MKKACILASSPRKQGNTNALLVPFAAQLTACGFQCETIRLYEKNIRPCTACRACQKSLESFGCAVDDDMAEISDSVLSSELMVFATPIYSWYCTPPLKATLDRMVCGMNKFYGPPVDWADSQTASSSQALTENVQVFRQQTTPEKVSLWRGKYAAVITTCGYRPERGADLFEEGIKRYCRHSGLNYIGMLAERQLGYDTVFMDDEKELRAKEFACRLAELIG